MTVRFVTTGDDLALPASTITPAGSIFRAMRHAAAGNASTAAYWYDRAENEHRAPVRLDATLAANDVDGTGIQRMPAVEKMADGRLLCLWSQINNVTDTDNDGARLVRSFVDYDLAAGTITVSPYVVLYQPTLWSSMLGSAKHPTIIKLPTDAATHPGRTIVLFNVNDSADGTSGSSSQFVIWNVYEMHSDNDGATWSTAAKIYDAPGSPTIPRQAVLGSCGSFVRIPSGTNAGRLVVPIWTAISGPHYTLYSDDDGATWVAGTAISPWPGLNEWSIAWRPDGTLIGDMRNDGGVGNQSYMVSEDDGVTWGPTWTAKADWHTVNCAHSTVQASTSPDDGYSKLLWSGIDNPQGLGYRKGLQLRVSHDGGLTYQHQYVPIDAATAAGYSDVKMLGGDAFAVVWESGFNVTCSMHVYIANLAEAYANGTAH